MDFFNHLISDELGRSDVWGPFAVGAVQNYEIENARHPAPNERPRRPLEAGTNQNSRLRSRQVFFGKFET